MSLYNIASDCVDLQAEHHPEKTAVLFASEGSSAYQKISFDVVRRETNRFANAVASRGMERGDRVILHLPNGFEFIIGFIGAIKAGFLPVPVSPLLTESEVMSLKNDSDARLVLRLNDPLWKELAEYSEAFRIKSTHAEDPAYWLYTSGTEGFPRGVIHAHRSIPAHDERVRLWQNFQEGDVVFNTSGLSWSYALTSGWLDIWRHGGTVVVYEGSPKAEEILRVVKQCGVALFMSVPGIYRRLASSPLLKDAFSNVRVSLSAGEKLPEEVERNFFEKTGCKIRQGLGMTEHSVYLLDGRPPSGSRIAVLREDLTEAEPGETGILASHRSCPGLMVGYHQRPEEERESFREEWFLSGDLAYRDGDGNFFFVGRRDDIIKAGGCKISPLEIETVLNQCPVVEESAVTGAEPESGKTIVVAFVVLKSGNVASEAMKKDILFQVSEYLAPYKLPRDVVFLSDLPKTKNGKIRRRNLVYTKR